MKTVARMTIAAAVAAAMQGCAGGGGGGGDGASGLSDAFTCLGSYGIVCGSSEGGASKSQSTDAAKSSSAAATATQSLTPVDTPLANWTDLKADQTAQATGPAMYVAYTFPAPVDGDAARVTWVSSPTIYDPGAAQTVDIRYDAKGDLYWYDGFVQTETFLTLEGIGQPEIDVVRSTYSGLDNFQIPFISGEGYQVGLVANPYRVGWNYQSFGSWNNGGMDHGSVMAQSFGAVAPASGLPTSGSATFTGKLGGFYVSPSGQGSIAAANLSVAADFASRSLSLSSSSTTLTRDLSTATAAPQLNLSGTLTYAPGTNAFSGTLSNAGATMSGTSNGQFYGPAAQELGGVFTVKSPTTVETFAGAYGAKR